MKGMSRGEMFEMANDLERLQVDLHKVGESIAKATAKTGLMSRILFQTVNNEVTATLRVGDGLPKFPGGRLRSDGPGSAEEFRDDVLAPALFKAHKETSVVMVNFCGIAGASSAWLDEAFGGLVRKHNWGKNDLSDLLLLTNGWDDDPDNMTVAAAWEAVDAAWEETQGGAR